jgi:hypothetical protein
MTEAKVQFMTTIDGVAVMGTDFCVNVRANCISRIEVEQPGVSKPVVFQEPFEMKDLRELSDEYESWNAVYYNCICCASEYKVDQNAKACEAAHVVCRRCWKQMSRCPFCQANYRGEGQVRYVCKFGDSNSNRRYGFAYDSSNIHVYMKGHHELNEGERIMIANAEASERLLTAQYNVMIAAIPRIQPLARVVVEEDASTVELEADDAQSITSEELEIPQVLDSPGGVPIPPFRHQIVHRRLQRADLQTPRAPRAGGVRQPPIPPPLPRGPLHNITQSASSSRTGIRPRSVAMGRVYERNQRIQNLVRHRVQDVEMEAQAREPDQENQ